jgi:SLT domain-containing protein
MLAQIQSESGGDANISQQITDVNGTGDAAGVGLLQVIPNTFAAFRDPSLPNDRRDPAANMAAALRYYKSRYGTDLSTMWGQGHGYDQGGIANGIGLMMKQTIKPERVLNPRQTETFESALPLLESINSSVWSPSRINPGALNINTQTAPRESAPGFAPVINARVANVDDLADLVERQAQMKAIGLSAALP